MFNGFMFSHIFVDQCNKVDSRGVKYIGCFDCSVQYAYTVELLLHTGSYCRLFQPESIDM